MEEVNTNNREDDKREDQEKETNNSSCDQFFGSLNLFGITLRYNKTVSAKHNDQDSNGTRNTQQKCEDTRDKSRRIGMENPKTSIYCIALTVGISLCTWRRRWWWFCCDGGTAIFAIVYTTNV